MVDLSISIASYNTKDELRRCLHSIYSNTKGISFEITVVDNASADGSPKMVEQHFPSAVLIRNKENVGFGRAHNQAFKISNGKYFLILNSDTYIYPETLKQMKTFLDEHPDIGVIGCKMYTDEEQIFLTHSHVIPNAINSIILFTDFCKFFPKSFICRNYWNKSYQFWDMSDPMEVTGIDGGAILIRREAFQDIGGFDENYFLFFEENDLFRQLKKKGWKIYYFPEAKILHYVHRSASGRNLVSVFKRSYNYYYRKYYGLSGLILINTALFLSKVFLYFVDIIKRTKKAPFSELELIEDEKSVEIKLPKIKNNRRNYLEIAPNETFSIRIATRAETESLILSHDFLRKLPGNPLFLRLVSVSNKHTIKKILASGKIKF